MLLGGKGQLYVQPAASSVSGTPRSDQGGGGGKVCRAQYDGGVSVINVSIGDGIHSGGR